MSHGEVEAHTAAVVEPRILRIFISYASEDREIALALGDILQRALGDVFAEINIDKWFLQAGSEFKRQIEAKLERTNILIIINTGSEKPSHSWTGWEVGYFERIMRSSPDRQIVPLYLDSAPTVVASTQGLSLGIARASLYLDPEEFDRRNTVLDDDPTCQFLERLQEKVDEIRELGGYPEAIRRTDQEPTACVQALRSRVFRFSCTTIEDTIRPQRQLLIKTTGSALQTSIPEIPRDAELVPLGSGSPMSIFGLNNVEMNWETFLRLTTDRKYAASWKQALTSVVMSFVPDKINVDNSQIVISDDERASCRIILTSVAKFYDDRRELNLYLVDALSRSEFGSRSTTVLLKGLQLVCHFRFMFLERDSEFSGNSILATPLARLPDLAQRLVREINLLGRDAREAGMDQPHVWTNFVDWNHILEMTSSYEPREAKIREIGGKILELKAETASLELLRTQLSETVLEMEELTRPQNTLLLRSMAEKLRHLVDGNT